MTPAATPYSIRSNMHGAYIRTADSLPARQDPGLTIKASHAMQRGSSYENHFSVMHQPPLSPVPSPPHTAPIKPRNSIDKADFPNLDLFNMSKLQMDVSADQSDRSNIEFSPLSKATSSAMSSFQSSPEMTNSSLFGEVDLAMHGAAMSSRLSNVTETQSNVNMSSYPSPGKEVKHRRNESSSDLGDLEEIVEDTGVTSDEIASFISGPNANNKWVCLYTGCGKDFGRKENIKSHVQTHLGDRQYRCKLCSKRFVRQHDLKRHANTHSNEREYVCDCGKPFARQDALTRHKQRGMCIGAFEGCIKKIGKRGRPKKAKPVSNCNDEKAAKLRMEVLERMGLGDSSSCASSVSSHPSPPEVTDNLGTAFDGTQHMSPQQPQQSHLDGHLHPSQTTSPMIFPELPMSRQGSGDSGYSQYSTLPELELSSSSPATSKYQHDISSSDAGTGSSILVPSMQVSKDVSQLFADHCFDKDFDLVAELGQAAITPRKGSFFDFMDIESEDGSTAKSTGEPKNDGLAALREQDAALERDFKELFGTKDTNEDDGEGYLWR